MLTALFSEDASLFKEDYKERWKAIPDSNEFFNDLANIHPSYSPVEAINRRLSLNNLFFMASRETSEGESVLYFSSSINGNFVLAECKMREPVATMQVSARTLNPP